jgi:hypothetical protein
MENSLDVKLDLVRVLMYYSTFGARAKVDRRRRILVEYGRVGTLTIE